MKLYGCPDTRSSRAVWALEEARADYQYVFVDLFKGEGRRHAYQAVNPAGKVPVLVDGALTLTESAAIVTYVGERYPASGLVPQDPIARADYLRWCFFVIGELEQPLWTLAKHRFALPPERRVPAIEETACWEFGRAAALVEQALAERKFILGNRFSGADILIANTLSWTKRSGAIALSPRLQAYTEGLLAREAAVRAREREQTAARQ
ncbi:MAG: glutathione S-transferase family protein [Chromatiales bacterium]